MMIFTRQSFGVALRTAVRERYRYISRAADALGMDRSDLSRAWTGRRDGHRMGLDRMLRVVDRLGYEIHFEIRPKNVLPSHSGTRSMTTSQAADAPSPR